MDALLLCSGRRISLLCWLQLMHVMHNLNAFIQRKSIGYLFLHFLSHHQKLLYFSPFYYVITVALILCL